MAIHRDKYTRYDGPLSETGGWWVVAAQTVKRMVGLLRTKIIIPLLWIVPVIAAVAIVAEYGIRGEIEGFQPPTGYAVVQFVQIQFYSLAVLLMASAPGVVSDDLQYNVLELYESKPIERWEYTLGKFLGLVGIGSLVTVGPAIGVGALRIALLSQYGFAGDVAIQVAWGVGLSLVMTALLAIVVVGLSSTTERSGFVTLAVLGLLFVPPIVAMLVGLSVDNASLPWLIDLRANLAMVGDILVAGEELDVPIWAPLLGLAAYGGGGLGLHLWSLDRFAEGGR
jgi:ABC-type transport system involved in multi-copper enzyme maturation permease subunit